MFPLAKFKRVEDEDGNEDEDEDEEEEDEVEEDIEEKVRRDSLRLLGEDDDRLVDVAPSVLIPLLIMFIKGAEKRVRPPHVPCQDAPISRTRHKLILFHR